MSTSAESIRDSLAGVAEDRRLQYFRNLLHDFAEEVSTKREKLAQFRVWLDQWSDQTIKRLYQQHYNPTYLNLLSVFAEELAIDAVQSLAIKCIKEKLWNECEYYFHLSQLIELIKSGQNTTKEQTLRLKGWDTDLIRSLLARGRGLIICSFRFGAVRFIPSEIAMLGFPILEAVNKPTHETMQSAFESLGDCGVGSIRLLETVNAEDERCTVQLVDRLKRRGIIGLCLEGNTGTDGPWGDTSKSRLTFLGHTIRAKNGAARLAAALRAPILPVMALKDGDASGRLFFHEPIIPPAGLKRSENEEFVRTSMQSLYDLLESYVRRYPQQWEGWSALHRWREPDDVAVNDGLSDNSDPQRISELLHDGKRFRMNPHRVAQLPTKDGVMWVDLTTLKGFQNPKWAGNENILATLSRPQGLDLTWIDSPGRDPQWKERMCLLLAHLQGSGLVSSC